METRNGEADYPIEEGTLSNTGGSSVSYTGGYVSSARAGNAGPVNEGDQYGTVVEAGDSTDPATPGAVAIRVYFTPHGVEMLELVTLSVYPTVDPGVLTGESEPVRLVDVHFHPCSFNHDCASMAMLLLEQERASVGAQWVFGLQHNMAPNAAPWRRAAFELDPAEHSMGGDLPDDDVSAMTMQVCVFLRPSRRLLLCITATTNTLALLRRRRSTTPTRCARPTGSRSARRLRTLVSCR